MDIRIDKIKLNYVVIYSFPTSYPAKNVPGIYAVELTGTLSDEILGLCEDYGMPARTKKNN